MTAQPVEPAPAPERAACPVCGQKALRARETPITRKRRVKFGLVWVLITLISLGVGLLLWLIWPRRTETIGVDRYLECGACGARV